MMVFTLVLALVNTFLLLHGVQAMPWHEPGSTPAGLIEMKGMSPRPTKAPGPDGIPHELLKRALNTVVYPPSPSVCGYYLSGFSTVTVTCATSYTCAYSGSFIDCITNLDSPSFITTCYSATQNCPASCQSNLHVLYCGAVTRPFCGTFSFSNGYTAHNCVPTSAQSPIAVSYFDLFTSTSATTVSTSRSTTSTSSSSSASTSTSSVSTSRLISPTSSLSSPAIIFPSPPPTEGIATTTIVGIVVGICGSLAIFAGMVGFLCVQRRNRNRAAAAAAAATQTVPLARLDNNNAPMQYPVVGQGFQDPQSLPSKPGFNQSSHDRGAFGGQSPPPQYLHLQNNPTNMSSISPPPMMQNFSGSHSDPHSPVNETKLQNFNSSNIHTQPVSPTITEANYFSGSASAPPKGQVPPNVIHEVSASQIHHPRSPSNAHGVPTEPELRYEPYSPAASPLSPDHPGTIGAQTQSPHVSTAPHSHVGPR